MNFSPHVKAWLQLISLVLSTGGVVTITARAGGAGWGYALFCGLVTGAGHVYAALRDSPKTQAAKAAATNPPIPPPVPARPDSSG